MKYKGLSQKEAENRLKKFGPNEIQTSKKFLPLSILLNQLKSPLIYILIFAGAMSIILKEFKDAIFILIVVFVNSALGFYQEYKAENTLEKLKSKVSKTVKVIRDGQKQTIDTSLLVPGDLIVLEPGLNIPADGHILEQTELSINESVLTGESEPVSKKHSDGKGVEHLDNSHKIFKGTLVLQGIGIAEITETGIKTEFGKIAQSLESSIERPTPTKNRIVLIGKILSVFIVSISLAVFFLGLVRNIPLNEILLTSIALGVSTIPEGLVIAYTITLVLGMQRIMAGKAIVKNLPAAETLGNIDVLCIDKTGTLTLGEMKVNGIDFEDKEHALRALALCNNDTNFVDKAVKEFIISEVSDTYFEKMQDSRKHFFPFNSQSKYTGAADNEFLYVTGAPEVIFDFCIDIDKKWKNELHQKSLEGNRTIAVAYKLQDKDGPQREDIRDMKLLGLIFIKDPIRDTVKETLHRIKDYDITLKVITGDLKETSLTVLQTLDWDVKEEETLSGEQLSKIENEKNLDQTIKKTKLFYRTTPEQKLIIVQSLQRHGLKVAMMGDGVNDSPALKRAEIGMVVDNATDVSKEVADLILLDSNFETIINAVEEGRNIFRNLKKIFIFVFSDSLSETVLIFLTLLAGLPLPLRPLHILWINIIVDGLPSLALSFDRTPRNTLLKRNTGSVFDKNVIILIIIIGLFTDLITFLIFKYLIDQGQELIKVQTIVLTFIALSSLFFLFSAKTIESNIWKQNIFNNKVVNISVLFGIFLTVAAVYFKPFNDILHTVPLSLSEFGVIIALTLVNIFLIEIGKLFSRKLSNN